MNMPHSTEAEAMALGCILMDQSLIHVLPNLASPETFHSERHRQIYKTMLDIADQGGVVDLESLSVALADKMEIGELNQALSHVPDPRNLELYTEKVRDTYRLRRLMEISATITTSCQEHGASGKEVVLAAEAAILGLANDGPMHRDIRLGAAMGENLASLEKMHERGGQYLNSIPTGYTRLDAMTAGLGQGDLVYIAGRPGMGKTSLAFCITMNMARAGRHVGFFSLEMPYSQLALRAHCAQARISIQKARNCELGKDDVRSLASVPLERFETCIIDDSPSMDVLHIKSKCRRWKHERGLDIVFIDYIQLLDGPKAENRNLQLGAISKSLKALAKELSIPVVVMSQLSRDSERRTDRRPLLADLRDSGCLEQDADLVLFPFAPEVGGDSEIIVGKQRNGPTGSVPVCFAKEFCLFENPYHGQVYP